jgi:hypothetical protein
MAESIRRAVREGLEFGVCAGLVFVVADIVAAVIQFQPVFYPLRQIAGAVAGSAEPVIREMPTGAVVLSGIVVHLVLSALFGAVYGLVNAGFSDRTQTRWDRQVVIGLLFGTAVWAVKFQLLARYVYPGLFDNRQVQFLQLVLHTFFFGLPLALFYTSAERRLRPLRRALQGV